MDYVGGIVKEGVGHMMSGAAQSGGEYAGDMVIGAGDYLENGGRQAGERVSTMFGGYGDAIKAKGGGIPSTGYGLDNMTVSASSAANRARNMTRSNSVPVDTTVSASSAKQPGRTYSPYTRAAAMTAAAGTAAGLTYWALPRGAADKQDMPDPDKQVGTGVALNKTGSTAGSGGKVVPRSQLKSHAAASKPTYSSPTVPTVKMASGSTYKKPTPIKPAAAKKSTTPSTASALSKTANTSSMTGKPVSGGARTKPVPAYYSSSSYTNASSSTGGAGAGGSGIKSPTGTSSAATPRPSGSGSRMTPKQLRALRQQQNKDSYAKSTKVAHTPSQAAANPVKKAPTKRGTANKATAVSAH